MTERNLAVAGQNSWRRPAKVIDVESYVQIERLLRHEPRGDKRNKLVEEIFALKRA